MVDLATSGEGTRYGMVVPDRYCVSLAGYRRVGRGVVCGQDKCLPGTEGWGLATLTTSRAHAKRWAIPADPLPCTDLS